MRILQVSTMDQAGGAERVAWNLFHSYRSRGHDSWMAVGYKKSSESGVFEIASNARWLKRIRRLPDIIRGFESFCFPGTASLLRITPGVPDVLHCHNLHGNYFDLRMLPSLS